MIDYDYLVDSAMRVLIRDVLISIEKQGGLPGGHYFHIAFVTKYDGVQISMNLLERYPNEMVIALQNQFKNLKVEGDTFAVDLSFGGQEERLVIPFCAITSFVDPSKNFMLKMAPDNTGMFGKSKFHEMINSSMDSKSDEGGEDVEDKIINFSEIKNLLK